MKFLLFIMKQEKKRKKVSIYNQFMYLHVRYLEKILFEY